VNDGTEFFAAETEAVRTRRNRGYRSDSAFSGLGLRRRGGIGAGAGAISSAGNDSKRAFMVSNSFTPGGICVHGIMPKVAGSVRY
jgi:hypothetical protein